MVKWLGQKCTAQPSGGCCFLRGTPTLLAGHALPGQCFLSRMTCHPSPGEVTLLNVIQGVPQHHLHGHIEAIAMSIPMIMQCWIMYLSQVLRLPRCRLIIPDLLPSLQENTLLR